MKLKYTLFALLGLVGTACSNQELEEGSVDAGQVQVTAGIAIGAIVHLVGVECIVDCLCGTVYIGEEGIAFFLADVNDFADMVFADNDAAAGDGSVP